MSKLITALMLGSSIAITGCATSYLQDNLISPETTRTQSFDKDNMIAIGILKDQAKTTDTLFLGEKYSYMIHSGGNELLKIIEEVPAEHRALMSSAPISFNFNSETNFKGDLRLRHTTPLDQMTISQQEQLKALGFNQEIILREKDGGRNNYLYAVIPFQGTQYQAVSPDLIQNRLSQPYPIAINKNILHKKEKAKAKSLTGILLMPIAIGVDLVTLPVTIGVIGYELTHKEPFK